ncbi:MULTISPECIES: PTS sugar transporter subunit IIA [Actinomyces]|uniref:Phosphotransferase/anion transporter n=1 Tax=Actinomyces glycerinitolerans TaxID=1892869 RepID=A0A1M4RWN7_9ACTO|nr:MULTISPECIES: PTS sugar transporter subunit IIA [Actinomyces]SHE24394.1 phosphotransferase/anion transporter [Actinomyces glycerinitolerans]
MFEKELIVFSDTEYASKDAVIEGMAELVANKVDSVEGFANAVKEREAAFCTYIDHGVAIPHGKTDIVKSPFVIYQRLGKGVTWGEDGEVATHVFMIGVPEAAAGNLHLRILAELSKGLVREAFRDRLLGTDSKEEVFEILKDVEKEIVK